MKKYNGTAWVDTTLRQYKTATADIESTIYTDGTAITSYTIKGNTVQNGTPTPSNPSDVQGVGVRTENLVDESKVTPNTYMDASGGTGGSTVTNLTDYIDINASPFVISGVITGSIRNANTRIVCFYDSNKNFISAVAYSPNVMTSPALISDIPQNAKYVRFSFDKAFENGIMLNLGSTALPYEPYGFKIPISNGQQTTNIYLGSTQTTRRIRKLVLDGTENWRMSSSEQSWFYCLDIVRVQPDTVALCAHYQYYPPSYSTTGTLPNGGFAYDIIVSEAYTAIAMVNSAYSTIDDFKAYLAQQYANGTPVTIWYVYERATTAAVNEPLMKIGDYADTLSNATAIPTTEGANSINVDTTVQPSEFTATWTGWHNASVKEWDGSQWNE